MPTYTLRVNSDIAQIGTFNRFGGPSTNWGALSDVNNNTGLTSLGSTERTLQLGLANATGTIPGGDVIVAVTPYLVLFDSRNSFIYAGFDSAVGIYSSGYPVAEGAAFVSQVPSTAYTTVNGPRCTYPPGQPNVDWSLAAVDALNLQIKSRQATNYYEAYVVVETITGGSVTVSAPTGTIADRGPNIAWDYSIGQQYQGSALVKVFTSAQVAAGGFVPLTSAAFSSATILGTASTWDTFYDPGDGSASRGTKLPDDTYRAYVWVTHAGTNNVFGGTFTTFTVSDPVTTPTITAPAANSTITSSTPTLTATATTQAGGASKQIEFSVASNSGFTTDVQTILASTVVSGKSISSITSASVAIPSGSRLPQGLWYYRVRAKDEFGTFGSYSATQQFTVAHAPAASNLTPSLGISSAYSTSKTVSWTFSDPSSTDTQTAYQVQIGKGSNFTATIDTGIVVSASNSYVATIDATYKDIDIWWRVKVRDTDNVWSDWSATQIFRTSDLPTVTITNPATGGVVTTPTPTLSWTFAASGGRTQSAWLAYILDTTASPNVIVETSGWVVGTGTTWTPALPVVALSRNYTAHVELKDNNGLVGVDDNTFTATYTTPDAFSFTLTSSTYSTTGLVQLSWPTAIADGNFVAWRVYRRPLGGAWKLVRNVTTASTLTWADYTAPSNTALEYAVVQAATRFGLVVESPYLAQAFNDNNENYMIVCPDLPSLNATLHSVRGDTFSDEKEQAVINVIGRGRVVQHGTKYGKSGSLDVAFYDNPSETARAQRLNVEKARDSGLALYLRNPFGDVWPVTMVDFSVTRISGVGNREYATASVSYDEVSE